MTLIVSTNDVVDQWKRNIFESFRMCDVITGRDAFSINYSKEKHQYLVLNYDKFGQEDSPNLILTPAKQRIEFVILDEVHFTNIRLFYGDKPRETLKTDYHVIDVEGRCRR